MNEFDLRSVYFVHFFMAAVWLLTDYKLRSVAVLFHAAREQGFEMGFVGFAGDCGDFDLFEASFF